MWLVAQVHVLFQRTRTGAGHEPRVHRVRLLASHLGQVHSLSLERQHLSPPTHIRRVHCYHRYNCLFLLLFIYSCNIWSYIWVKDQYVMLQLRYPLHAQHTPMTSSIYLKGRFRPVLFLNDRYKRRRSFARWKLRLGRWKQLRVYGSSSSCAPEIGTCAGGGHKCWE